MTATPKLFSSLHSKGALSADCPPQHLHPTHRLLLQPILTMSSIRSRRPRMVRRQLRGNSRVYQGSVEISGKV